MRKICVLALLTVIAILPVSAQYQVKGIVTDSTGVGEPYATVRIYSQASKAKAVKVLATDADGKFSQELATAGKYEVKVSSVGKKPLTREFELSNAEKTADLGRLVMKLAANALGEVEVRAQKPLVKTEIDRVSYDVQSDEDSKTNTVLEMLRKVPMVTVDGQDNIMVKGSSNFKIYKNGRPDNMFSKNAKEVLKAIPASMIKRIEVITEPGAKYDAEGVNGILNIVMNDDTSLGGVMGTVNVGANTNGNPRVGAYLLTQIKKLTLSVNYGYHHFGGENQHSFGEDSQTFDATGAVSRSSNESRSHGHVNYGNVEGSYEIDSLNLITLSGGGYGYDFSTRADGDRSLTAADGSLIYSYRGTTVEPQTTRYYEFSGKLDYQHLTHHKDESIIFSYLLSTSNNKSQTSDSYYDAVNMPVAYTLSRSHGREHFYEHTFQLDWTRPFNAHNKLEMGAKYILRNNNSVNDLYYNNVDTTSNYDFSHITQVGALYSEYAYSLKKWSARAGLRYEYSYLSAKRHDGRGENYHKNLNDLVPTLSMSYNINQQNSLKLNYAVRIERPGISYLNPTVVYSPTSVSQGNPNVSSARNNSASLSYMYISPKITLNANLSYSFSNSFITQVITSKDNVTYSTYDNVGKSREWNLNMYAQWQLTKTTSLMFNLSGGHDRYVNDNQAISNQRWHLFIYSQLTQQLPWKLRLGVSGGRQDMGAQGLYAYYNPNYFYFFNLTRNFMKGDRLTVRLEMMNPFSSKYNEWKGHGLNAGYTSTNVGRYLQRSFGITVSYRFGDLKAQVKKTAKTIENDDIVGGNKKSAQ